MPRQPGAPTVPFGKHRGDAITDLPADYLRWMLRTGARDTGSPLGEFVTEHRDAIDTAIELASRRSAEQFVPDYQLNASQMEAVETIERELLGNCATHHFRLEGGAGYGKSFAVVEVVRRALLAGLQVQACATSYVATQVLSSQLAPIGVEAKTIASTIRLAKVELEDREEYEQTPETGDALRELLGSRRLLVVDEYSMVGDDIAERMLEAAATHGGKLLVVGDQRQLPPVKQRRDSCFVRIPGVVALTEPMRYGTDSDLFALATLARFDPDRLVTDGEGPWKTRGEVVLHPDLDRLVGRYVDDMKRDPRSDARMLFFRRQDVLAANARIRYDLFGEKCVLEPVIEDERLMAMSTADVVDERRGEPKRWYSGETFLVTEVTETEREGIPCYVVEFSTGARVPVIFAASTVLTAASMRGSEAYVSKLTELRDEALESGEWSRWRRFKNAFLQVGYNYAMTVHRCQGQTVDRAYFSIGALRRGGEMADRLLYVAATRARREVHMVPG